MPCQTFLKWQSGSNSSALPARTEGATHQGSRVGTHASQVSQRDIKKRDSHRRVVVPPVPCDGYWPTAESLPDRVAVGGVPPPLLVRPEDGAGLLDRGGAASRTLELGGLDGLEERRLSGRARRLRSTQQTTRRVPCRTPRACNTACYKVAVSSHAELSKAAAGSAGLRGGEVCNGSCVAVNSISFARLRVRCTPHGGASYV